MYSHRCACVHWSEEGTEAKMTLTALLALHQTHTQSEAQMTWLLSWAAEATEQRFPGFSLPEPWATQEGQCSCNFLISVYNPQVESTSHDYHVFRVICKHKFLSPCFLLWGFSPHMPHCCMSGRAFLSGCHTLQSWFTRATQCTHFPLQTALFLLKSLF